MFHELFPGKFWDGWFENVRFSLILLVRSQIFSSESDYISESTFPTIPSAENHYLRSQLHVFDQQQLFAVIYGLQLFDATQLHHVSISCFHSTAHHPLLWSLNLKKNTKKIPDLKMNFLMYLYPAFTKGRPWQLHHRRNLCHLLL